MMDIRDRSFEFSVRMVQFCQTWSEPTGVLPQLAQSLIQAASAIGIQVEEAHGSGKADFIAHMHAAAQSARASQYWLRLLAELPLQGMDMDKAIDKATMAELLDEAQQLAAILSSIVKTARRGEGLR